MYWNLQGIFLQISREWISKEDGQSGQIKYEGETIIVTWKKIIKKVARTGEASAAKCCQINKTRKDMIGNIKLIPVGDTSSKLLNE